MSVSRRLKKIGLLASDQILIAGSGFAASWVAVRILNHDDYATFVLCWTFGWSAFAVASETLITRSRVLDSVEGARGLNGPALLHLSRLSALIILPILLVLLLTLGDSSRITVAASSVSIVVGAVCFHTARAIRHSKGQAGRNIRVSAIYIILITGAFEVLDEFQIDVGPSLFVLVISIGLTSLSWTNGLGIVRGATKANFDVFRRLLLSGIPFGVATAIRALMVNVLIVIAVATVRPQVDLVTYGAALVLTSPVQVLSSGVPWILLPRLASAAAAGDRASLMREARLQLGIYVAMGVAYAGVMFVGFDLLSRIVLGGTDKLSLVSDQVFPIVAGGLGIVLTSWSSTISQAAGRAVPQLVAAICGGLIALVAILCGVQVVWVICIPYLTSFVIVVAVNWTLVWRRLGHSNSSTDWVA